ncbi:MAG: FAD-dependent oxidoreductase [Candidatus Dormibacteraceae bacterium]
MRSRKVAVLGAGTAGLSAALALARQGHRVTVVERDPLVASSPQEAFGWERRGIPHFLQPHSFIPRGRKELITHFPDVYEQLTRAGAHDIDLRPKLPGTPGPGDEDLQYLGARRPLIEWALRQAVLAQPGVEVVASEHVRGIRLERNRLTSISVDGRSIDVDVAVDAMGRRTAMRGWLADLGSKPPSQERSECGVIYYSRYYRVRPGLELPGGPWLISPRGDLGYMAYSSFPGDNGTFAAVLAVPTGVPELKIFKDERAFEAAIARIPILRMWVHPELVDPITPVLAMGGLQNTINCYDETTPIGLFPVADAFCHTDPALALGLSFSLIHGVQVARALHEHEDLSDAFAAYNAATMPTLRERYDFASALDDQRHRTWIGHSVDFARRTGDYALFSTVAAGVAAMLDPEVFRVFARRIGLLDSTRVLDDDVALQKRIEEIFSGTLVKPRPLQGPTREEMLALCRESVGAGLSPSDSNHADAK